MKKILISVLIILLLILAIFTIVKGIHIGNFNILSYSEILDKNNELEEKITEASRLTSVSFPEKQSGLTSASKQLVTTRQQYEDKIAYSSEEDVRRAKEIKNFEIDFLFTQLGNYAKRYGLVMDLQPITTSASGIYDLKFTLHGKYSLISDFVRSIENDSKLNFVIENFKLVPDTSNVTLRAEFVVTGLKLNIDESITSIINTTTEQVQNSEQSTNTTDTITQSPEESIAENTVQ